jgi:hypothetical protein
MTIADKVRRAKTDLDEVHAAGVEEGKALGGYTKGYEDGKRAEYDAFWDTVQNYGNRTDYGKAFLGWNCEYIRPKYKVTPSDRVTSVNTFYGNKTLKKIEAEYFDFSQKTRGNSITTGWYWTFSTCAALEEIEDIGMMPDTAYDATFAFCYGLKKIAKITTDKDVQFGDTFRGCNALEDITFEGEIGNNINFQWSTKLTKASITSVVNALSNTASGRTLQLSKTAVDNAFPTWFDNPETGEQENLGCDINSEWVALVASKSNWIITLV